MVYNKRSYTYNIYNVLDKCLRNGMVYSNNIQNIYKYYTLYNNIKSYLLKQQHIKSSQLTIVNKFFFFSNEAAPLILHNITHKHKIKRRR